MSEWRVVLRSNRDQLIRYNASSNELQVSTPSEYPTCCPTCGRAFQFDGDNLTAAYFRMLSMMHNEGTPRLTSEVIEGVEQPWLNQGYFDRFFRKGPLLGRGGRGVVFKCTHQLLNDLELGEYAVKMVPVGDDPQWLSARVQEVQTMMLKHENIVEYKHAWVEMARIADFGPTIPCLFILMEYAAGGSLEVACKTDPVALIRGIAKGLAHLHAQGILHRDLKPSNILLRADGTPLLSDFGEATQQGYVTLRTGATGTLEFMAPELLVRNAQGNLVHRHTESSDVWSLGMISHWLLTGHTIYRQTDDIDELMREMKSLDSVDMRFSDSKLTPLIREMLSLDPRKRPSAAQVVQRLDFKVNSPVEWRETVSKVILLLNAAYIFIPCYPRMPGLISLAFLLASALLPNAEGRVALFIASILLHKCA